MVRVRCPQADEYNRSVRREKDRPQNCMHTPGPGIPGGQGTPHPSSDQEERRTDKCEQGHDDTNPPRASCIQYPDDTPENGKDEPEQEWKQIEAMDDTRNTRR